MNILRKIIAALTVVVVIISSYFTWVFIEIGFDGCCGAPPDATNDTAQLLVHLAALGVAAAIIWASVRFLWLAKKR